jgi:hypothetical protein
MITTRDETNDLMKTLLFTLGVITGSTPEARQQIADAYSEARELAATIPWEKGSARPRVVACLERFKRHKEAGQVDAAAAPGSVTPPCASQMARNLRKAAPLSSSMQARVRPSPSTAPGAASSKAPARSSARLRRSRGAAASLRSTLSTSRASRAEWIDVGSDD